VSALHAAVNVGGTFIDIIIADRHSSSVGIAKLPSDKGVQGRDLVAALEGLARQCGSRVEDIDSIVIGTTVVTNVLLESSLARTALLTTRGFRDILEIARMERSSSYELRRRRPAPLVLRHLRFEVSERVAANGDVVHELEEESLAPIMRRLRDAAVESVAVCLLFSFANARHELRIGEIVVGSLRFLYRCPPMSSRSSGNTNARAPR
jgi:N-methylhydantoinase A